MSCNLDKGNAKILVLGDSGVGKSSLIHLICHSTVLNSPHWTIGCSIEVKIYENYFIEFWEIGGSRNHKLARSFLYQDYDGILLVYDATNNKSRANLNEWLVEVKRKINDPVITIATYRSATKLGYDNGDSSVINIDENIQARSSHSQSQIDEPLLSDRVIYVNTQDVLSFKIGSRNQEKLNEFFKQVVERRNKKFYNKFAI